MTDPLRPLAHAGLTFNAPLAEERAADLVEQLHIAPGGHVLDLGCGWGELLLRIVAAHPGTTGTGVDLDRAALDRGRTRVVELALVERVDLVEADATTFRDHGDVVLSIGASHAWGGTEPALRALAGHVEPGGLLLFGAGFWAQQPSEEVRAIFGDLPDGLDGLATAAAAAGLDVSRAEEATLAEWDAFEAGWREGLERSSVPGALEVAVARKAEYERGYRGVLGFAYLILRSS